MGVVNPFKKVGKAYKAAKRITRVTSKAKISKTVAKSIKKAVKPSRIKKQIRKQKIKTVYAAQRAKCKVTRKGCFVAGTKIAVKEGFMPIEKIKAGDRVWSEDTKTGNKELKEVKKIFVREKDSIIRLSINGEIIETTDEHPFFVKDIGWIPAGELSCADLVKLKSDDYESIESYDVIALDEPIKVYNFEVADNHTYYVSESKVLVHNDYKKTYQTYTKTNPVTGEVYVGRTSGTGTAFENVLKRDRNHHMNAKGFGPAKLDKSSRSKNAIRGREQLMIEKFRKKGKSGNAINGISPKNKNRKKYLGAARRAFGKE